MQISVFYACDGDFLKYVSVSIASLKQNASKNHKYIIHILHTDVRPEMRDLLPPDTDNFRIVFDDVSPFLSTLKDKLPLRDYYNRTTYFRLFIPEIYPFLSKAIYLDADTVVTGDVAELFKIDPGQNYVAAAVEQVMVQHPVFGEYVEKTLGIPRSRYFNAGVLVLNCKRMRKEYFLEQFTSLLNDYRFVVTQDEDYLNVLCRNKVTYLPGEWNLQTYGDPICPVEKANVVHYVMSRKPWNYRGCPYEDLFWRYAALSPCAGELAGEPERYTDEKRAADLEGEKRLVDLAQAEIARPDNYLNQFIRQKNAPDRMAVLKKIRDYEKNGRFDEDVEEDPPAPPLTPDGIDYLRSSLGEKIKTGIAKAAARIFYNKLIRTKTMIIKEIRGVEHVRNLSSGAVLTCNHFNALDSFAMAAVYDASRQKKKGRKMFRIIREGNYTNFPGFYGFLMRHYDTLPLSSNGQTMRKFLRATDKLLHDGHMILIYPEQSMWWNYRKPKPLKPGGFTLAVKNNVPVLPCFITMNDSTILGNDGFFVQEYTIHICPPIFPDPAKNHRENVQYMMEKNADLWREIYETTYGKPLSYEETETPGGTF